MKLAYFDCFSGISGDMLISALIDAGLEFEYLRDELRKLNIAGYEIKAEKVMKNNISATKFNVISKESNKEKNLNEINAIIDNSSLDSEIKSLIKKIFLKIAEAEAKVHNEPINEIHFHEIGAIDTIIDIAGAVIGIKKLGIEKIYCSKINVGSGFVEFSHGRFPVPAPATAEILKNIPIYSTNSNAELTTPTGAAIISVLAESFGEMPVMKIEKVGYGAGAKDLEQPNVLRVFIGEIDENYNRETIDIIETNIDNMNPEIYPYVIDKLIENGALDAYLTSIVMKKGRVGVKLSVLSKPKDTDKLSDIIFNETTTLGIRIFRAERKILEREIKEVNTKYGKIRVKISKSGNEIKNITPEYEDCVRIAKANEIPLKFVYEEVRNLVSELLRKH